MKRPKYNADEMPLPRFMAIQDVYIDYLEKQLNQMNFSNDMQNVSIYEIQAYAKFCIECDRKGMNPLTWEGYLEIG